MDLRAKRFLFESALLPKHKGRAEDAFHPTSVLTDGLTL
jgi:hypothetical protein